MVYYKNADPDSAKNLLSHYGIQIHSIGLDQDIPHSFWGNPEAGRTCEQLYIRADTPLHSLLHEACHYVCMPSNRRTLAQVDAQGTAMEENATCYLQLILADHLDGYSQSQLMEDMDDWGYSFRLGSSQAWFSQDAEEVKLWLINEKIINQNEQPTWKLRK